MRKNPLSLLICFAIIFCIIPLYVNAVNCTYYVNIKDDSNIAIPYASAQVYYYDGVAYTYQNTTANSSGMATTSSPMPGKIPEPLTVKAWSKKVRGSII